MKRGDYDRAIADYDQAIRLNPKYGRAFNNRGNAYQSKGDYDHALADYNQSIQIDPNQAYPYNGRANAYAAKQDYAHALADYAQAIRLSPQYTLALLNRGNTYAAMGDYDHAVADYTTIIQIDPKNAGGYFPRGRTNLYAGALAKALADLDQASEINPRNGYVALWLDIASRRSKLPSRLAAATTQLDMTKWPAPVIRLYLDQLTPDAVLAAADDPDANTKIGRICEANIYGGELALQKGAKDDAVRQFKLATAGCPKNYMEWTGANAELKTLGMTP